MNPELSYIINAVSSFWFNAAKRSRIWCHFSKEGSRRGWWLSLGDFEHGMRLPGLVTAQGITATGLRYESSFKS